MIRHTHCVAGLGDSPHLTGLDNPKEIAVMSQYQFTVIVPTSSLTHDEILDATDALGDCGCTDAAIRGHAEGMELLFDRAAESLQAAISSAISDVERAGYRVLKVELEREAIPG